MNNTEPIIAPETWTRLVESLEEGVLEIAEIFLEDTPKKLDEIESSYQQGDFETSARIAHSLKSSSAIFGAFKFSALCIEIENAIEQEEGGILDRLQELRRVYVETRRQILNYLSQSGYSLHED